MYAGAYRRRMIFFFIALQQQSVPSLVTLGAYIHVDSVAYIHVDSVAHIHMNVRAHTFVCTHVRDWEKMNKYMSEYVYMWHVHSCLLGCDW